MTYRAPVKDMLFAMKELAGIDELTKLHLFENAGYDTAQAVLEECAKFNEDVVAPLNVEGDRNPSYFKDGNVISTPGFKEAFKQFGEGGWQGLQHPTDFGGQGLPKLIGAACGEMINSANVSFALCPLLSDGAIEALLTAGSDVQKATFLPNMLSGKWTGSNDPDGAAGRLRPVAGAHPRRAPGRRHVQAVRHQDLHHVGRTR